MNSSVLIVDDVAKNLQVLGKMLQDSGYQIYASTRGKQALKILQKIDIDLILLDVSMPEMDGFEVCRIIKADSRIKDIPVMFVTAHGETEDIIAGFEQGAVDYISKPFNRIELLHRVKTHIGIRKQQVEIEKSNIFLAEQNNKISALVTELNRKNEEVMSSIRYAQVIQKAVLPSESFISQFIPDFFIINIPRDIVSGDFYWVKHVGNEIIVAVGDSTGHGVPGAFVSMLGMTYLNEVVDKLSNRDEFKASDVLDLMRTKIKSALHQDRRKDTMSAGIDLALCIIDIEKQTLQYAGAYNPLFIIRNNAEGTAHELIHLKGDKMPLSVHIDEKAFTNNTVELQTNDILYMFSDGFTDQFGGKQGMKYKMGNFKTLLLETSEQPLEKQKEILLKTYYDWKQDLKQVDDVLVLGIKIQQSYGDVDFF